MGGSSFLSPPLRSPESCHPPQDTVCPCPDNFSAPSIILEQRFLHSPGTCFLAHQEEHAPSTALMQPGFLAGKCITPRMSVSICSRYGRPLCTAVWPSLHRRVTDRMVSMGRWRIPSGGFCDPLDVLHTAFITDLASSLHSSPWFPPTLRLQGHKAALRPI